MLIEPGFLAPEDFKIFEKKSEVKISFNLLLQFGKVWFRSLHVKEPDEHAQADFILDRFINNRGLKNHPLEGYFCGNILQMQDWL